MPRGRKSIASLTTVVPHPTKYGRPPPPDELTEEQAKEWESVVKRMPAQWFRREHFAMLASYCRLVVSARMLSQQIDAFRPEWMKTDDGVDRLDRLGRMRDREVRSMAMLATRLRLTHQSQMRSETAGRAARKIGADTPRPWDDPESWDA